MAKPTILYVMGVSGCGKTTIGRLLAEALDYPLSDGDDYHTDANVRKMAGGEPLTDEDRKDWLLRLNQLAIDHVDTGAVIGCSALKRQYRTLLRADLENRCTFVHLEGDYEAIKKRMDNRIGHFMPPGLLESQFKTLEPPKDAIRVTIGNTPEEIVTKILFELGKVD